jgi:hypothetical protein
MISLMCRGIRLIQACICDYGRSDHICFHAFSIKALFKGAPREVVVFFIYGQQGSIALRSGEFPGQINVKDFAVPR